TIYVARAEKERNGVINPNAPPFSLITVTGDLCTRDSFREKSLLVCAVPSFATKTKTPGQMLRGENG
ncbi:hypothetical protein, partial [Kluyvera georgiana]|uniref:hypothetical protein n=1 Tax=Kluyvera georgiana TaxID=73098 RepID=UPI001ADEE79A